GPAVHVNRVALSVELGGSTPDPIVRLCLIRRADCRAGLVRDQANPVLVVFATGAPGTVLVVADHVLERRHRAAEVEGIALVRNRVEENPAGLQLAEVGLDRSDWVLGVLE